MTKDGNLRLRRSVRSSRGAGIRGASSCSCSSAGASGGCAARRRLRHARSARRQGWLDARANRASRGAVRVCEDKTQTIGQKPAQTPANAAQSATLLAAARAAAGKISSNIAATAGAQNAIALATTYALSARRERRAQLKLPPSPRCSINSTQRDAQTSRGADAVGSHFETELEINDFPQFARYKVTHKDTLAANHGAHRRRGHGQGAISPPPGRPLAPGDRKLYLLIEGPTERVVKEGKELRQEHHRDRHR